MVAQVTFYLFFYNAPATTEIYTLSLHDALPICGSRASAKSASIRSGRSSSPTTIFKGRPSSMRDRKSTRLNSSHLGISYAVFCLKKKKKHETPNTATMNDSNWSSLHPDDNTYNL